MATTTGNPNCKPVLQETFKAAANLSSYQYCFVYLSASNTVNYVNGATTIPCGVLQDKPDAAGESALVMQRGITLLKLGGDVSRNTYVSGTTAGVAITAADGKVNAALALEDGVSGDYIPALLCGDVWKTIS